MDLLVWPFMRWANPNLPSIDRPCNSGSHMMRVFYPDVWFLSWDIYFRDESLVCGWVSKCVSTHRVSCGEIAGKPLWFFFLSLAYTVCALVTHSSRVWYVDLVMVGSSDLIYVSMTIGWLGLVSWAGWQRDLNFNNNKDRERIGSIPRVFNP